MKSSAKFLLFVMIGLIFSLGGRLAEAKPAWKSDPVTPPPTTASITVNLASPSSPSGISGGAFGMTFNFAGGPTATDKTVFVHFVDSSGTIAFQADHLPPVATSKWNGSISYQKTIAIPTRVATGSYRVLIGLADSTGRLQLLEGTGVVSAGSNRYQIASLKVTSTAPSPTPTPTPTPTPAPTATSMVPSGYDVVPATDYGAKCDGVTDDTLALQNAIKALSINKALKLPAGTCVIASTLQVSNKSDIAIFGAGKNMTIIKLVDPIQKGLTVNQSTNVVLQDFQIYGANTTSRSTNPGFYVRLSSGVHLFRLKSNNVSGGGFLFGSVTDSSIDSSEVYNSWADAFHITGGSRRITVKNSKATGAGDDCLASIGYMDKTTFVPNYNYDITFVNNFCSGTVGSGVDFAGTIGGKAYDNRLERNGTDGIRVNSDGYWKVAGPKNIDIQRNTLINVRTNQTNGHAAFMIYTGKPAGDPGVTDIVGVNFSNNVIIDPLTSKAMWLLSYGSAIKNVTIQNNKITDTTGTVTRCFGQTQTVAGDIIGEITVTGNTKNGVLCNN